MWDEAANGIPFGVLCEMLATYADPDGAAGRGARLSAWLDHSRASDCRFHRELEGRPDRMGAATDPNASR